MATRTRGDIFSEIEGRFGFLPPFFAQANSIDILESLWQQTLSSYIDNPLPDLLKEKLFAYLSRYCAKPYCLVCHSCFLLPLGLTANQVRSLVCLPTPDETEVMALLQQGMETENRAWRSSKGDLDHLIIRLSVVFYLKLRNSDAAQLLLGRILGEQFEHLVTFLAYVRMCGFWIDSHPELSYEADKRAQDSLTALLAGEPTLKDFFQTYVEVVRDELPNTHAQPWRAAAALEREAK